MRFDTSLKQSTGISASFININKTWPISSIDKNLIHVANIDVPSPAKLEINFTTASLELYTIYRRNNANILISKGKEMVTD